MIPLISGSVLGKRLRSFAGSLGYRVDLEYKSLALKPANILRIGPSWLLAKLSESRRELSFIQIGANDGIRCDPIRPYVLKQGWRGLLVEPDPVYFSQLIQNYKGVAGLQFLNAAVGEEQEADFYSVSKDAPGYPDWVYGIGSLDKLAILRHAHHLPDLARYIQVTKVRVVDINQIAERYLENRVDLLVLDVEGYDADLIESIDTRKWKPRAIFYESMHLPRTRHEQLLSWLITHDYSIHLGGQDSFAILPEFRDSI